MTEQPYIKQIELIFRKTSDMREAHKSAAPILIKMATEKHFLYDVIRNNFSKAGYWDKKREYNTLMFDVVNTTDFNIVINIFPSLPSKSTDVSFQSIHHHGALLLTTIAAFGPGYSSFVFKKGFRINKKKQETKMEVNKFYQNPLYNIEFLDSWVPHVVFYPAETSATIALWSNENKHLTDSLKQLSIFKKHKTIISKIISILGLNRVFGINQVENFDFYIKDKKIFALKERLHYPEGSNENFIRNMLSFTQQVGFKDDDFFNALIISNSVNDTAKKWIKKLLSEERITEQFEDCQLNIPKINISKKEIELAT